MAYDYEWPYVNSDKYNADWLLNEMKNVIAQWIQMQKDFAELQANFNNLETYVRNYFANLNVQQEINNKLDAMIADGTIDSIVSDYLSKNGYGINILPISSLQAASGYKIGTVVIGIKDGAMFPFTVSSTAGDISYPSADGKFFNYVISKTVEIDTRVLSGELQDELTNLITKGYLFFKLPSGQFILSLTVPARCHIRGEKDTTALFPGQESYVLKITGDYVHLEDLYITGDVNHNGILIDTTGTSMSEFINLHFNGLSSHINVHGNLIWCNFVNIKSESAAYAGLISIPGGFLNSSIFTNCRFNNESNPLIISESEPNNFGLVFNCCNLEYNTGSITLTGKNIFNGCYFEGNTGLKIRPALNTTFMGCCFINENALFNSELPQAKTDLISCYQYNTTSLIDDASKFNVFGGNIA